MDIIKVLETALLDRDPNKRTEAELQLNQAANHHFGEYVTLLINAMSNTEAKTEPRMLAGIALKNSLTAKDHKTKLSFHARWIELDFQTKSSVKTVALETLKTADDRVASSAAQLVAAIADIELPRNEWPELITIIMENTKPENPEHVKKASLLAIGYICESADPNNPAIISQASGILIAIVQGCQSSEPSNVVRLTALNALVNSLEFIKFNFEKEGERNYIMQVVCEATQADDSDLQASAFGCLAKIMSLYYRHMSLYMEKALYGLTVSGMQSSDEKVACMAVEFWSTVCEEELEISLQRQELGLDAVEVPDSADLITYNFALVAIQDVLPTLLTLLTRQNEDPEDDDWSVAMAAGACLQLFSQNIGNYIVEPTLQFVGANISSQDWRAKEAAVMAFGSILDGPDHDQLKSIIDQALPPILALIGDESLQVKETVAWCLGRIADLIVDAIELSKLQNLLEALVIGLKDHPMVSTNCCWTLMNLLEQLCADAPYNESSVMSNYYPTIIGILLELSNKEDNDFSSRASSYEALSTFVTYSAIDTMPVVQGIATEVLSRLDKTIQLQSQVANSEDKGNLEELQINILSLLTNIIRRIGSDIAADADSLVTLFLKLLEAQAPNSLIEEDIFIAISSVAGAIGQGFIKYMDVFFPYLVKALENTESPTCSTAIGLVADLSQSLGLQILPYLEKLMNIFLIILNDGEVKRELRPAIISCFGDIATSIGDSFQLYLEFVMGICSQASQVKVDDSSMESIDYALNVKESVLDCYVGVVGGMAEQPQVIYPYFGAIFQFIEGVAMDINMSSTDSIARLATGLLGDLAAMYPNGDFKQAYQQEWVTEFIKKTRSNPVFEEKTKDAARWARDQQKRQLAGF
ncbi:karyopherin-beta [Scheffersomyces stipitis CBS 6054]|uniref:Importin-95 n=1 Tax=Scheffersomyces stipitis (strain ATCC 58785 / CBS 6054 / NBRC 10063 / NRRL Y-11545) TaxID=322104 RepID=A3LR72_PICST|nr:karyopherin-beta [Scheffersomyces stipitis CBS 6054]ABN65334.2 karyopherin-beta [Scheffersomyces stipitis CBS 6054]KAG2733841.1 hypothetical protein G9P44_003366 [Scheffersomyces stipitis]